MVSLAHWTLIDDMKNGGLNLMDLETKRDALRVKLVGKFLNDNCVAKWKVYFNYVLSTFGQKSMSRLYQYNFLRDLHYLPGFYREVLVAWSRFLPSLTPVIMNKEQFMNIPFLNNPVFSFGGRALQNKAIMSADCMYLRNVCDSDGYLSAAVLCRELRLKGVPYRAGVIKILCEKIKQCNTPEWQMLLIGEDTKVLGMTVHFSFCKKQTN